jgi:hypothetical protein
MEGETVIAIVESSVLQTTVGSLKLNVIESPGQMLFPLFEVIVGDVSNEITVAIDDEVQL